MNLVKKDSRYQLSTVSAVLSGVATAAALTWLLPAAERMISLGGQMRNSTELRIGVLYALGVGVIVGAVCASKSSPILTAIPATWLAAAFGFASLALSQPNWYPQWLVNAWHGAGLAAPSIVIGALIVATVRSARRQDDRPTARPHEGRGRNRQG